MIHDPHQSPDAMCASLPRLSGFDARTHELGVFEELLPRFVNTAASTTTLRCAVTIWVCQAGGLSLGADRDPSGGKGRGGAKDAMDRPHGSSGRHLVRANQALPDRCSP